MANWHGYFGIENINLNLSQKQELVNALRALGPQSNPQPARLNHWRTRLDDDAAIFEALFNEANLTIQKFKERLGAIFSIDPDTIDHAVTNHSFSGGTTPVIVFSRLGVDYLRVALFGGVGASWNESGDECRGYLTLFVDEWE